MQVATDHGRGDLRVTGVGHMHRGQTGFGFEQFHSQVANRAYARRAVVPAVTTRAGRGQELLGAGARRAGRCAQHKRRDADQADWREFCQRVIGQLRVEQLGNRHIAVDHQADGVVIGGLGNKVGRNIASRPHLVLDQYRLPKCFGQWFGEGPGRQVGRCASRETHHQAQRLAGPSWRCLCAGLGFERSEKSSGAQQNGDKAYEF